MDRSQPAIRVGTASWTDPTLIRETQWYPRRSMSAHERLRYYADRFSVVEVDATYYYPPTRDLAVTWSERTPADFRMDIKAFALLTHHPASPRAVWPDVLADLPGEHEGKRNVYLSHLPPAAVDRAWEHFREALMPLHSAGRLGAVFLQFPPWFRPTRANLEYLTDLPQRLPDYDLAVEFRHGAWMRGPQADRTLALLGEASVAYVCVDEPQGFDTSVPPVLAATSPQLAVVRFHGHNRENWQRKGISAAERFRYLYSEEELARWAPRLEDLSRQTRETHVIMNNCYRDYGVRNAAQLAVMLGAARPATREEAAS
ncbi:MAG TPA: DUF72 domain-containing protein [Nitriliruptorales bacterium]|nr:DUF72 domain-containing protein [Nitriliruptorales bacterium]